MIGLAGEMETDTRFDKSTVRVGGVIGGGAAPNEAVTVYVPTLVPIARPELVTNKGEALHEAKFVTSCVEPSLKVAVAVSCCCFKNPMVAAAGVTATEDTVTLADLMASFALVETLPEVAVMSTVAGLPLPVDKAMARPCVGGLLLTVATLGSRQDHCAVVVKSFVLPSE